MLAEGGEEGSAVVGVSWECCHQLARVLSHLREWIKGRMLFRRWSALSKACLACGMAFLHQFTTAAVALHLSAARSGTPHHTKHRAGERAVHSACIEREES